MKHDSTSSYLEQNNGCHIKKNRPLAQGRYHKTTIYDFQSREYGWGYVVDDDNLAKRNKIREKICIKIRSQMWEFWQIYTSNLSNNTTL